MIPTVIVGIVFRDAEAKVAVAKMCPGDGVVLKRRSSPRLAGGASLQAGNNLGDRVVGHHQISLRKAGMAHDDRYLCARFEQAKNVVHVVADRSAHIREGAVHGRPPSTG